MFIRDKRAIALLTVLVFMLLVTIIAGAALSIMTKQARLAEHQIRRIKGFYAVESAINKAYQSLRVRGITAIPPACPQNNQWCNTGGAGLGVWQWNWNGAAGDMFEWRLDGAGNVLQQRQVTVLYNPNLVVTGGLQARQIRATVSYRPN
ncbi:MAG: hypothetical protein Q8L26_00555 [Candidatus Omnitrophota bacterium]|nr:hypothetical protein [Candidatus Omnitrophota bacterium]